MSRSNKTENAPKHILIIREDRIGDVVLTIPLAGFIKVKYPDARVTFLVREYTKPLVEMSALVDEVITTEEIGADRSIWKGIAELKKRKFDAAVLVYPNFRTSFMLAASFINIRVGTSYRWYSFLLNRRVPLRRKNGTRHELEHNAALLAGIGITDIDFTADNLYGIPVGGGQGKQLTDKPLVILHPGSGGSAVDTGVEKFRELAVKLIESDAVSVAVTGSEGEKELCHRVAEELPVRNYAGQFDLQGLTTLIGESSVFVANSTGPLHIAAALGKYCIGFYPKVEAISARRWGPYTTKKQVFEPKMECSNCTLEQCIRLQCMNSIDMDAVKEAILSAITKN